MAFTDEVDKWLSSVPRSHFPEFEELGSSNTLAEIEQQIKTTRAMLQRLEQMRKELRQASGRRQGANPATTGTAA